MTADLALARAWFDADACRPAGWRGEHVALYEGRIFISQEAPLPGAVQRPCARCRRRFKPTMRRRLLCGDCFRNDDLRIDGADE